jgi:hypothetical protein
MTCPSCGYPEPNRLGDWCPYCVTHPEVRGDGSRPWAELDRPMPFEQAEIAAHDANPGPVSDDRTPQGTESPTKESRF